MKIYFILQFNRALRELRTMGALPGIAIGLGVTAFVLASMALFRQSPAYAAYLYPLGALFICVLMNEREKTDFLRSVFPPNQFRILRIAENLLVALPFSLFLLYKHQFLAAGATIMACAAVALVRPMPLPAFQIPSPFSARPYEFTTGFRRNYLLFLTLYACSVIGFRVHNFNLELVLILAIALTASTFYSHLDPVFYVWIHALSGREFIKEKLRTGVFYGSMLLLPVFLPAVVFYPGKLILSAAILILGLMIIVLAILAAYVRFPARMSASHQLQFYLAIFFPPAMLLIIPNFYGQAVNRLKVFLKC